MPAVQHSNVTIVMKRLMGPPIRDYPRLLLRRSSRVGYFTPAMHHGFGGKQRPLTCPREPKRRAPYPRPRLERLVCSSLDFRTSVGGSIPPLGLSSMA